MNFFLFLKKNFLQLSKKFIFCFLSLYYFSFLMCYKNIDCKIIWYRGFLLFEQSFFYYIFFYFLAIIPSFFMPKTNKISSFFIWFLYLFVYIVFFAATPLFLREKTFYFIIFCLSIFFSFIIMIFLLDFLEKIDFKIHFLDIKINKKFLVFFSISACIISIFIASNGEITLDALDNTKTYQVRLKFKDQILSYNNFYYLIKILFQNSCYFFSVFVLCYGFFEKKHKYILVGIMLSFFLFLVSAYKSVFIFIFIQLFLIIFYKKLKKLFLNFFILSPMLLISLSLICDIFILKRYYLYPLFTSRLLSMHASLTYYYFDFFSKNDFFFLKESFFIRKIFNISGEETSSMPYTIGYYVFKNKMCHANENFWMDAYGNFGFFGIFIYSVIVVFILRIYSFIENKENFIYVFILNFYPLSVLISGSLPSALLSGGLLLSILLTKSLLAREEKSSQKRRCK